MPENWQDTIKGLHKDACQGICTWNKNWFHNPMGKLFHMGTKTLTWKLSCYVKKSSGVKNHLIYLNTKSILMMLDTKWTKCLQSFWYIKHLSRTTESTSKLCAKSSDVARNCHDASRGIHTCLYLALYKAVSTLIKQ